MNAKVVVLAMDHIDNRGFRSKQNRYTFNLRFTAALIH